MINQNKKVIVIILEDFLWLRHCAKLWILFFNLSLCIRGMSCYQAHFTDGGSQPCPRQQFPKILSGVFSDHKSGRIGMYLDNGHQRKGF